VGVGRQVAVAVLLRLTNEGKSTDGQKADGKEAGEGAGDDEGDV
jgi:hypothetical protein